MTLANRCLSVDLKKCQGCLSCMMACSLAHEGEANLSRSRIRVFQNPFERFPDDLKIHYCLQCAEPLCMQACPPGAIYADTENGNVKRINAQECIGCMSCITACPYSAMIWDIEKQQALKCDLCMDTPYWNQDKPACAEICPMKAIEEVRGSG